MNEVYKAARKQKGSSWDQETRGKRGQGISCGASTEKRTLVKKRREPQEGQSQYHLGGRGGPTGRKGRTNVAGRKEKGDGRKTEDPKKTRRDKPRGRPKRPTERNRSIID